MTDISVMGLLGSDVGMIVYRYLRDDNYDRVVRHFNEHIVPSWNPYGCYFEQSPGPLEANWRILPYYYRVCPCYIYNMWTSDQVVDDDGEYVVLPDNY